MIYTVIAFPLQINLELLVMSSGRITMQLKKKKNVVRLKVILIVIMYFSSTADGVYTCV